MNDDATDLPPKLIDYLNEQRAPRPPIADPDEPLQIDSLGLIRLVAFLESDLHIRVEDDELIAEHFATLRAISSLLENKTKRAVGRDSSKYERELIRTEAPR